MKAGKRKAGVDCHIRNRRVSRVLGWRCASFGLPGGRRDDNSKRKCRAEVVADKRRQDNDTMYTVAESNAEACESIRVCVSESDLTVCSNDDCTPYQPFALTAWVAGFFQRVSVSSFGLRQLPVRSAMQEYRQELL